jgi:hypothetical protein
MNPTCLAPLNGHFQRVLPQNRFDRVLNFVKFDILEPLWRTNAPPSQLAQNSEMVERPAN